MNKKYKIHNSEVLLDDFLTVKAYQLQHDLYRGGKSPELRRLLLEKEKAVSIQLYDPLQDSVVMVEQFRIGAKQELSQWLLENPAGYVETGESSEEVAYREVREETGCQLTDLIPICEFLVSPGISNEKIDLFCGRVDSTTAEGIHGLDTEGEDIRVEVLSFENAVDELYSGRINSTSSIITLQWLMLNKQQVNDRWLNRSDR